MSEIWFVNIYLPDRKQGDVQDVHKSTNSLWLWRFITYLSCPVSANDKQDWKVRNPSRITKTSNVFSNFRHNPWKTSITKGEEGSIILLLTVLRNAWITNVLKSQTHKIRKTFVKFVLLVSQYCLFQKFLVKILHIKESLLQK